MDKNLDDDYFDDGSDGIAQMEDEDPIEDENESDFMHQIEILDDDDHADFRASLTRYAAEPLPTTNNNGSKSKGYSVSGEQNDGGSDEDDQEYYDAWENYVYDSDEHEPPQSTRKRARQ